MNFRNDIQGLRAIAVILVFIFHLNSAFLPGGFVGVDIFFVISGYLISKIILQKKEKGTFSFVDFYIGRAKRIMPVFWVLLIFVLIAGGIIFVSSDISLLRKNVFWTFLFNSNNYYANLDSYFGVANKENPLLHTWTLSIEMQFYFLLPLLLILTPKKHLNFVGGCISFLLIGYSLYNTYFVNNVLKMYFSLPARIPEFLLGTAFVLGEEKIQSKLKKISSFVSIASIIAIILSAFFINEKSEFPGYLFLVPCIATGFLLINNKSSVNTFLSENKVMVYLGELSYSIYLWHWAIMAFIRYYYMEYEFSFFQYIIVIVLTLLFSYLSYTYVENYFRKLNNKLFLRNIVFLLSVFVGLFLGLVPVSKFFNDVPVKFSQPNIGLISHANTFQKVETFGALENKKDSILLIGDSHGLAYKEFLNQIGLKNNFSFNTITNNTYPNIPGIDKNDFQERRFYNQYLSLVNITDKELLKSKFIFIGSTWGQDIKSLPLALDNFIKKLKPQQKIIILTDFPSLDKNPIRINKSVKKNNDILQNYKVEYKKIPKNISDVIANKKNVFVIDLDYSKFKDLPFINDTVAYYDADHINNYGAGAAAKYLEKDFMNQFNNIKKNAK